MMNEVGPGTGQIANVANRYLFRTTGFLVATAALAAAGCGEVGPSKETAAVETVDEQIGSSEQALTECQIVCLPKLGCSRICPPPPPPPPPQPPRGSIVPEFYITHVVYAPPGRSSSVEYSSSTSVGSTTSAAKGIKKEVKVTAEASSSILAGSGVSVSAGLSGSRTKTDALELSLKYSQGYKKPGQVDGIDHDYDEIWFLVRPKLDFTYLQAATAGEQDEIRWKFGYQDGVNNGIPYFVYAGELNNSMEMRESVRRDLEFWGITPGDFATLLAADPLFTGTTPNMTMNPNRYQQVGVFPYTPPFSQNDQPSTQTFSIAQSTANTSTTEFDFDFSVGLTTTVGANFGLLSTKLVSESQWTWTCSSKYSTSSGSESTDTLTVGQPQFGYAGPTLLRVYLDKVFRTYAFTLDYPQGETNLALNKPAYQSSDLPGYGAVASRANDGNTNGNFWDGSVTHTDSFWTSWEEHWPGQYWYVDLGSERVVNSVKIFNRTDCCTERLSHYNVLAFDSAQGAWKVISNHSGDDTTGVPFFHHQVPMVRTQYVMVAKTDDNYLSLAEVQVLGF